MIGFSVITK